MVQLIPVIASGQNQVVGGADSRTT